MLIYRDGAYLFSGSSETVRNLRKKLLECLLPEDIIELFGRHGNNNNNNIKTPSYMIRPLIEKRWHSGGAWPADFVKVLGFPPIFAGVHQRNTKPSYEDIEPRELLPDLVEFQIGLKEKMLKVLEKEGHKTRCLVTLPTGGGKTRVAVEAFIDWMIPHFSEYKYLVWIAQSEELCEQVISCL